MRTKSTLLCFAIAICINTFIANAQVNVQDSLALVDLYDSTNGPQWNFNENWLVGPVSTWHGITVTNERVTQIFLAADNLSGSIPSSLGNLVNLKDLALWENQLSGSIPSSLGNLAGLTGLNLENNQLSGSIPSSLGNLVNLQVLYLFDNQLSGSIPSSFGNLSNLTDLDLNHNQLNGIIPSSLGNIKVLFYLDLTYNQLSGSIPSSLGNLVNLNWLFLQDNQLSDSIPSSLGNLSNLIGLYLYDNQLSGSIPSSLGNLVRHLSYLDLHDNQLSGNIPSSLGNLKPLDVLDLHNNHLSDSIPSSLGNLRLLNTLDLHNNHLRDSIPSSLGKLRYLAYLYLDSNQLSGSIPSSLGNLSSVFHSLDLSNNQLSGSIPSSLGKLGYLGYLYLNNNQLSGSIPSSFGNLNSLRFLDFSHNKFTFDGMELIAQTFSFAKYSNQARIPIHLNNNALSVSAGGTLINNTYLWYKKGKAGYTKIAGDSVFHPSESGVYIVRVRNKIATNLNLFSDTITYSAPIPLTAFSANSQSAISNSSFSVYPNPVKDLLYVKTNCNASFSLLDQSGKIMLTREINGTGNIDVSDLVAGLYYLKNNSNGIVRKIIITK